MLNEGEVSENGYPAVSIVYVPYLIERLPWGGLEPPCP